MARQHRSNINWVIPKRVNIRSPPVMNENRFDEDDFDGYKLRKTLKHHKIHQSYVCDIFSFSWFESSSQAEENQKQVKKPITPLFVDFPCPRGKWFPIFCQRHRLFVKAKESKPFPVVFHLIKSLQKPFFEPSSTNPHPNRITLIQRFALSCESRWNGASKSFAYLELEKSKMDLIKSCLTRKISIIKLW